MAAKKTTNSKTTKRKIAPKENVEIVHENSEPVEVGQGRGTKRTLFVLLAVVILVAAAYYLKGFFVVAMVNNKPITRTALISDLEKQYGQETLDSLITETLIKQEAQKQGITVDDAVVQEEVKGIEDNVSSQGQNLDDLLAAQGMTRESLERQVKIQKLIEMLLADKVSVTDEEIDQYIEENAEYFEEGQDPNEQREQVKQTLEQQKLSSEFQTWLTDTKSQANIDYYVKY